MKNAFAFMLLISQVCCQTSSSLQQPPKKGPGTSASAASAPSRATQARMRLEQSSAGKIVLRATETHGGLERWFSQSAIQFRYDYVPLTGLRRNSLQTVDVHRARAYHDLDGFGAFSWTGEEAFKEFREEYPVRFWALTPYYFVALPFVLSDAGVTLKVIQDSEGVQALRDAMRERQLTPFGAQHLPKVSVVKATFSVGDAPDDYYILYFAEDDGRLLAARYIVTYAPFYKADPSRVPKEKILFFEDLQAHAGLLISMRHEFYTMQEGGLGDKVTEATISEVKIDAPFDESRMVKSDNAIVDAFD